MKKGSKYPWLIIAGVCLAALVAPMIIAKTTYSPGKFKGFPGESADWFGFWASYSGTLATLLVALITWLNSRKMGELQRRYYELDTDANLRLNKVSIVPQISEKGKLNQYKMIFIFNNMAKNPIHEIGIKAYNTSRGKGQKSKCRVIVTIGETKEALDVLEPEYYLQDGKPVIQFYLKIDESPLKEMFAGFYYYFSQFSLDIPRMKIEIDMDIRYGEKDKDRTTRYLMVDLLPTPMIEHRKKYLEFSEEEYAAESYEVLIENYELKSAKNN